MGKSLRLVIFGGGAVGQVMARTLVSGAQVTVVDPRPEARSQLESAGIEAVEPDAFSGSAWDAALVATKSVAMGDVVARVPDRTPVITLCNGLQRIEPGDARLLAGVVEFAASINGQGRAVVTRRGPVWLPRSELTWRLQAAASAGEVQLRLTDDIQRRRWAKLVLNAAVEPVAASAGYSYGEVFADALARRLMCDLLAEGMAVARSMGVAPLPGIHGVAPGLVWLLMRLPILGGICGRIARHSARHVASTMLHDVRRGGETEVEHLCGTIAAFGREAGVATPGHRQALQMVRHLETGQLQPSPANLRLFAQGLNLRAGTADAPDALLAAES